MRNNTAAAGPGRIRALNRKAVLAYIRKNGPTPRSDLIPALKLSAAGVSSVTNELVNNALLRADLPGAGSDLGARGRPKSPLALNPDAAYALGLRLQPVDGRCRIQMAWIDYAGQIRQLEPLVFDDFKRADGVIDAVRSALSILEQAVPDSRRIRSAAVAIPGVVTRDDVLFAPALEVIVGRSFASAIASQIDYPIALANDVNLAVLSELHAQPRLSQLNFAYLYIGAGIGAGLGLRGQLWTANGWEGEVGHVCINRGSEPRASFETLLSPSKAFAAETKRLGLAPDNLGAIADAAAGGDQATKAVLNEYAQILCELILVLVAVPGLDEVIIDFPSDRLFSHLRPILEGLISAQPLKVAISSPAEDDGAAVRGAAISALDVTIEQVELTTFTQAS